MAIVDGDSQSDGCRNTCFQGQIQCVGDQARDEQNADGCWVWGLRNNVKTGHVVNVEAVSQRMAVILSASRTRVVVLVNSFKSSEFEVGCFRFDEPQACPGKASADFKNVLSGRMRPRPNRMRSGWCSNMSLRRAMRTVSGHNLRGWTPLPRGSVRAQPCNHECIVAGQRECEGERIRTCQRDANLC